MIISIKEIKENPRSLQPILQRVKIVLFFFLSLHAHGLAKQQPIIFFFNCLSDYRGGCWYGT
jgi:hypothetical protein